MRQAIHIFTKDARHLRWEILLLVATIFLYSWSEMLVRQPGSGIGVSIVDIHGFAGANVVESLYWINPIAPVLIFVLAFVLIGRVVHSEALPGERQFWLTRPYSRKSLLGAKCLFLAVFLLGPLAASDVVLVKHWGFAVTDYVQGLLGEQAVRLVMIGAPALVLATITRTAASQIFAGLAMGIALVSGISFVLTSGSYTSWPWPALDWVHNFVSAVALLIVSVAIVWWQYSRRRTLEARIATGCGAVLIFVLGVLPVPASMAIQNRVRKNAVDASAIHLTLDPPPEGITKPGASAQVVWLRLPVTIHGLPEGMRMWADQMQFMIGRNGGSSGLPMADWFAVDGSHAVILVKDLRPRSFQIDGAGIDGPGTRINGRALVTLGANARSERLNWNGQTAFVPGLGQCHLQTPLLCYRPFRDTRSIASTLGQVYLPSYLPFPATLALDPVTESFFHGDGPVPTEVTLEDPVAHFFYDFEFEHSKFSDYFIEPPTAPRSGTP